MAITRQIISVQQYRKLLALSQKKNALSNILEIPEQLFGFLFCGEKNLFLLENIQQESNKNTFFRDMFEIPVYRRLRYEKL